MKSLTSLGTGIILFTSLALSLGAAGSAEAQRPAADAGVVTVYSHRHYPADQKIFDEFTATTGIKVVVLQGEADQLIQRIKAEGAASPADLLITADVGRLHLARTLGLLAPVKSAALERIPSPLRDPQGHWFGLTKRARVLIYDKTRLSAPPATTYAELADPRLAGQVVIRSSSNVYNISLVAALADRWGAEATTRWARGLVANLARAPQGGDRDQIKAVAAGQGTVAVSNTYYLGQMLSSSDPAERAVAERMAIVFPDQASGQEGTHVNVSGAGVVATSPQPANARRLLEYLASPAAQAVFAAENHEYPVLPGVAPSPLVASWGSFREDARNLEVLGRNSPLALEIADKAGWK